MRLAIDVRCLQDQYWTGVANYTWNNIKALARYKDLSQVFYGNNLKGVKLPPELENWGRVVVRRWPNKLQDLGWRLNMWPSLDKLLGESNKPDWLWIPNPNFFRASTNIKTALTIHDLSFLHFPEFFTFKKRIWYLNFVKTLVKKHLRNMNLVLAVSENTRRDILELDGAAESKVRVVYPGVDDVFFNKASTQDIERLRRDFNLPAKYLLSVGTLEPRKNHLLLLKMYSELTNRFPDWDLDLVIAGPYGWGAKNLIKYWHNLRNRDRVHFLAYLPAHLQPALYQQASIFLYPSYYEGFGFPVLEAMASKVPCLVSNVSSLPELVGGGAILLSPWEMFSWVESVYNLRQNDTKRKVLAQAGQARARRFSWAASAGQIYNLFKEL